MKLSTDRRNAEGCVAAIEAGGTKFICALAKTDGTLVQQARIPTSSPIETFSHIKSFFCDRVASNIPIVAGGVASFGPINLDRRSAHFGYMLTTPKPRWSGVDVLGQVQEILKAPTLIDTDVNAAALAELRFGAGKGMSDICYITVGTGIGVGILSDGKPVGSNMHPEAGHMHVPIAPGDDFPGTCPYHGTCVEGMASGPAIKARWGTDGENLPHDHPAWEIEAHYIAHLCANLTYTLRPDRIIIGGGVFGQSHLYQKVRERFKGIMKGYAPGPAADSDHFIVPPGVTEHPPGLLGAVELAKQAAANPKA